MSTFHPRLLEAVTASARMDALCDFIEFWLGPRRPPFGESAEGLDERPLPLPLRRLYEFAGRWPDRESDEPVEYTVSALSHQDSLVALDRVKFEDDGKIVFLWENQACWHCRTLTNGDDPPVWCYGDHMNEDGTWFQGERLVCDSLSRFLVTFTLQELTLGSRLYLCDEGLARRFDAERASAVPVWSNGPYVHGSSQHYDLWGDVLVGALWGDGDPFLAANHHEGVEFLMKNQGPVIEIHLMRYGPWNLDIRSDGSAQARYQSEPIDERIEAPAGTFNFPEILAKLSSAASDEGQYERNTMVAFRRKGQRGGVRCQHLHDTALVTSL